MLGISRWAGKGGSYLTIQRFFSSSLPWDAMNWAIAKLALEKAKGVILIAGDATTVTKSGKKTGMVQNQGVLLNTRRASPCHVSSIKIDLTKLIGVKRLVETVDNPTAQASVNVAFLLRLQLVIYPPDADGSCAEKAGGLK